MATLEQIRDWVVSTIDDPSLDTDEVDILINEGLTEVADRVLLKALEASATVTTVVDTTVADLPANYSRNLYGCSVADYYAQPEVLPSAAVMQDRYPGIEADNAEGEVKFICPRAGELMYHPVPAAATDIVIRYYKAPTALAADGDIPTEIPLRLHRKLLVNYACAEIFSDIEDGIEGQKVNTLKHEGNFKKALVDLEETTKEGQSRPGPPQGGGQFI